MSINQEKSRRGRNSRVIGAKKERQTVEWFRDRGWVAIHNTHGSFDVMALRLGERARVVEVKYGARPYGNYSPRERALTLADALQAGAEAWLAWWEPRASEPELIHSSEWPA